MPRKKKFLQDPSAISLFQKTIQSISDEKSNIEAQQLELRKLKLKQRDKENDLWMSFRRMQQI